MLILGEGGLCSVSAAGVGVRLGSLVPSGALALGSSLAFGKEGQRAPSSVRLSGSSPAVVTMGPCDAGVKCGEGKHPTVRMESQCFRGSGLQGCGLPVCYCTFFLPLVRQEGSRGLEQDDCPHSCQKSIWSFSCFVSFCFLG